VGRGAVDADRTSGLANELVALSVVAELMTWSQHNDDDKHVIANKCTEIAFRVMLSLTQDDAAWCQTLLEDALTLPFIMRTIMKSHAQRCSALSDRRVTGATIQAEDDNDAQILDRLCLALGLLTNLVQGSDTAKDLTRKTRLDPACTSKHICIQTCQCPRRVSALDCLAQVYIKQSNDSNDIDPGATFLRGHFAVLLGLLMRDNNANQKVLLAVLPGPSNRKKLASIAGQAREFVTFYAELAIRLSTAATAKDKDEDGDDALASRSDDHNKVERMVGDGNGNTAREVISFLEYLSAQQS